jgi:peptidoglycan hydrolase-like protein with peptidoglycan-binding domain
MTTVDDVAGAEPVTYTEPEPEEPRRRRRSRFWLAFGGAVIALAVGVGAWLWVSNTSSETSPAATRPAATAVVERGTIAATESWDGTLDHATPFTVTSSGEGMVTWLIGQGETVERGDELYRVDEQPVTLLYGVVPMYRDLGPGDAGADVDQLESNLAELGYIGLPVDDEYGPATAEAVRAWQSAIGAERTGTVARRDVVFVPERGQVDALRSNVGTVVEPGIAILDITGTDQVVNLEADIDDRNRLEIDTKVTVVLPGGDEVTGTVSATAVVEVAPEGAQGAAGADAATESILQVEIATDENAANEFVGATVEVIVAVDERTDVVMVPVNALLALAEGGYGLELVADDGTTSIVAVETGLFADGSVEIRSDDIAEGAVVGVAGR